MPPTLPVAAYSLRGLAHLGADPYSRSNTAIRRSALRATVSSPRGFGPLAPHWELRSQLKYSIDEQAVSQGLYPFRVNAA